MLIFYVDEIGIGSLNNASVIAHPWFILGAVGIRDINRKSIAKALCNIKQDIFGTTPQSGSWNDTEIKGRYLAHAERRLNQGLKPLKPAGYQNLTTNNLKNLVDSLFKVFRTFSPVLYAIGIDKAKHLQVQRSSRHYDPIAIAYAYLQQRLALLVGHTSNAEECALIMADEQKHHESLFRKGEVQAVRRHLQIRMRIAPNIADIIAKPVWIDSDEMVIDREIAQLADFMLYAVRYGMTQGNWNHPWLVSLSPHFARHWGSGRGIGAVWNAGITIYPRTYYRKVPWANM